MAANANAAAVVMLRRRRDDGPREKDRYEQDEDSRVQTLAKSAAGALRLDDHSVRNPALQAAAAELSNSFNISVPLKNVIGEEPEAFLLDGQLKKRQLYCGAELGGWHDRFFGLTTYRILYVKQKTFSGRPRLSAMKKHALLISISKMEEVTYEFRSPSAMAQKVSGTTYGFTIFFDNGTRWVLKAPSKIQADAWYTTVSLAIKHAKDSGQQISNTVEATPPKQPQPQLSELSYQAQPREPDS